MQFVLIFVVRCCFCYLCVKKKVRLNAFQLLCCCCKLQNGRENCGIFTHSIIWSKTIFRCKPWIIFIFFSFSNVPFITLEVDTQNESHWTRREIPAGKTILSVRFPCILFSFCFNFCISIWLWQLLRWIVNWERIMWINQFALQTVQTNSQIWFYVTCTKKTHFRFQLIYWICSFPFACVDSFRFSFPLCSEKCVGFA